MGRNRRESEVRILSPKVGIWIQTWFKPKVCHMLFRVEKTSHCRNEKRSNAIHEDNSTSLKDRKSAWDVRSLVVSIVGINCFKTKLAAINDVALRLREYIATHKHHPRMIKQATRVQYLQSQMCLLGKRVRMNVAFLFWMGFVINVQCGGGVSKRSNSKNGAPLAHWILATNDTVRNSTSLLYRKRVKLEETRIRSLIANNRSHPSRNQSKQMTSCASRFSPNFETLDHSLSLYYT